VTEVGALFGDVPEPKAAEVKSSKAGVKLTKEDSKVLGYLLLSDPYSATSLHPLTVGCVIQHVPTKRYYLKVKVLSFTLQYLQNFVNLDPQTNQKINKLSGKQLVNHDDIVAMNKEILNHRDTIGSLYAVFLRTSVTKDKWPADDSNFTVFTDIAEANIELEDMESVVDFTRCSYSVFNGHKVHQYGKNQVFVLGRAKGKLQLAEYTIETTKEKDGEYQPEVSIDKGKELELDQEYERVFHVERNVALLSKTSL